MGSRTRDTTPLGPASSANSLGVTHANKSPFRDGLRLELPPVPVGERLLALVYAELRRPAAQKLAQGKPAQTLAATAFVHEAYMRLELMAHLEKLKPSAF